MHAIPRLHSLAGAPSTIGIDISRVLADREVPVRVRVCVEGKCESIRKPDGTAGLDWVYVDDPSIAHAGSVQVELVIAAGSGAPIFDEIVSVDLFKMQPNGPDCEPTKYAATLTADSGGRLVEDSP